MATLTKDEQRTTPSLPPPSEDEYAAATRKHARRVRRLKIHVAAWVAGTAGITTLWVLDQRSDHGSFEHFGNSGNPGDWNPTLWALAVGVWGFIVGVMALRVYFRRPVTREDAGGEAERTRLERVRWLRFHIAAWVLGMLVFTPLWALVEWQDNGGFERWSNNGQRGDWDPWILTVGAIWALVIALFALRVYLVSPATEARIAGRLRQLRRR